MEYTVVEIKDENYTPIRSFIKHAGSSLESFRYFNKRPLSVIKNHLYTVVFEIDGKAAAYGHLDQEDDVVWLGIAVAQDFKQKGLGIAMMHDLIAKGKQRGVKEIVLSVDKDNAAAIKLYEKLMFEHLRDLNEKVQIMNLQLN